MDNLLSYSSSNLDVDRAIQEIAVHIHQKPQLIIYFASTVYSFRQLDQAFQKRYPTSQIVGVTTTGEIGTKGFNTKSLSVQSYAMQFGKIEAVLMNDIEKYPIFERTKLTNAAKKVGIHVTSKQIEKEGLAYIFPVGLKAGEENMLSVVNSIFEHDGFSIFGGTAGDDAKFQETFVSVNGEISSTGGAVIFMKPTADFYIYKENIFKSTNKQLKITKSSPEKRIVYEINGKKAANAYAEALNVPVSKLTDHWFLHPLGRKFNEDFYNASPFTVHPDGSVEFYAQVYEGAVLEVLEPLPAVEQLTHTIEHFRNEFATLDGVLGINCILRKIQFEKQNIYKPLNEQLAKLPNLCGFSSYGEQVNKSQLNQTLILIGFGKRK
jgi:hypothetical protein